MLPSHPSKICGNKRGFWSVLFFTMIEQNLSKQSNQIEALDGLSAAAVLLVVASYCSVFIISLS